MHEVIFAILNSKINFSIVDNIKHFLINVINKLFKFISDNVLCIFLYVLYIVDIFISYFRTQNYQYPWRPCYLHKTRQIKSFELNLLHIKTTNFLEKNRLPDGASVKANMDEYITAWELTVLHIQVWSRYFSYYSK